MFGEHQTAMAYRTFTLFITKGCFIASYFHSAFNETLTGFLLIENSQALTISSKTVNYGHPSYDEC